MCHSSHADSALEDDANKTQMALKLDSTLASNFTIVNLEEYTYGTSRQCGIEGNIGRLNLRDHGHRPSFTNLI